MSGQYYPQRIVSLQPSASVILAAIGRLDSLVACTKYCLDVCRELRGREMIIVADSWTAQTEQITSAHPDLVIAAVPYQEKAVAEILKCGARFLGLAPKTLADIDRDIACIAGIVGRGDQAKRVIAEMRREIEAVRSATKDLPRPRVFCEEWGKPLIASQPWVAELVNAAGGEFLGDPGKQISPEQVQALDPEVIVMAWCGAGDRVPLKKVIGDRKWEDVTATRNGRVYCIRDEFLNTPAPTLVSGLHALAAAIHPEQFSATEGLACIAEHSGKR